MSRLAGSRHDTPVDRAPVERASETLLAWAHYHLASDQDRLLADIDDPVEALAALRCQVGLVEAATRRAKHLLALATAGTVTGATRENARG